MHKLPKLDYEYSALEPYIDAKTMKIHHTKHHQGYVNKLNVALKGTKYEKKELEWLLKNLDKLPEEMVPAVRNNGGGHYNHSLFWEVIGPPKGLPKGDHKSLLKEAVKRDFGGGKQVIEEFSKAAMSVFGSGWVWMGVEDGKIKICKTQNQDNPLMFSGGCGCGDCQCGKGVEFKPILGLDVWEHAYYLKYQNKRDEYVKNFWKVVDWMKVEEKYRQALG